MCILIDQYTRVLVQGITGRDGSFHATRMKANGTNIVAGVSPGKGGSKINEIPVFNTVSDAVAETYANTSIIFVPAAFAKDAILEAADAGIELIITITEGIPTRDIIEVLPFLQRQATMLIGPNSPGVISPGKCMIGIMPPEIFSDGPVGLISRSGTLTYEVVNQLTQNGFGQTTCVGVGGDPVAGLYYQELLDMFEKDSDTKAVVLIGEIGGDAEERVARYIKEHITKPVVAFVAGQTAPPDKRMGHAGAIISSGTGTASEKIVAFEAAGVVVARKPSDIPKLIRERI